MKLGYDGNAAKRRKLEQLENAIAVTTLRILETKRQNRDSLNLDNAGDSDQKNNDRRLNNFVKLTKYPPMTGVDWFGLSSADGLHRGYLSERQLRSIIKKYIYVLK